MNPDDLPPELKAIFNTLPPASGLYILDEQGEPQPCADVLTWAAWMEAHRSEKFVAQDIDEREGHEKVRVSTIFLGMDHGFFTEGPPILWETMVFGGALDGEQQRYASRDAALRGHQAMCRRVTRA